MLTLFRPGAGPWHRMPTGPKTVLLAVLVLGVSVLPATWGFAVVPVAACIAAYALPGVGLGELGRQVWSLRWLIAISLLGQAIFLGAEPAVVGTLRIIAAVTLASLLAVTTPVSVLLSSFERALGPARVVGVDPARAALLLVVALGTVPTLVRLAGDVRDAQRARGGPRGIRFFVVPFLILALRHADDLGDALTARGVE